MRGRATGLWVALICLSCLAACWFDSRSLHTADAQRQRAADLRPAPLSSTEAGADPGAPAQPTVVLKVRVHATPGYTAENIHWQTRLAELLGDANRVLEPSINARLQLASVDVWRPETAAEGMRDRLERLERLDPGTGVHLVVGCLEASSRFSRSFDELGVAQLLGKYLVVRALNDAVEYDAMETELDELSAAERTRLHGERLKHKATTVFLHEVGHSLGALHVDQNAAIMSPHYSHQARAFLPQSIDLMRITIEHRRRGTLDTSQALAKELLQRLRDGAGGVWVESERLDQVARLTPVAAERPSPQASQTNREPAAGLEPPPPACLSAEDRTLWGNAVRLQNEGNPEGALKVASQLSDRYPDDYTVQDFRCQLAMKRGGAWPTVQAHCRRLMELVRPQHRR